ncbi:MAG: EAL domain-containing protein [Kangiellaceae bacterium]|nr:EAL domain-containing protein [Kangiellaceae bacterium]
MTLSLLPPSTSNAASAIESALYRITELAISTESLDDYYSKIHRIIAELTYAENFYIVLFDGEVGHYKFVYYIDEEDDDSLDDLEEISLAAETVTLTSYLLENKTMQHLSATDVESLVENGHVAMFGEPSVDWLGVPLQYRDELLGAMVIQSYDKNIVYGQREEQVLQFVAQQIALLIKNKFAEKKLVEANQSLELRVAERTHTLERINRVMQLENEERKKSEKIQTALFRITDLVSTTQSQNEFFEKVHSTISSLMYATNFYIAMLSEDEQYVDFIYHVDQQDSQPEGRQFSFDSENTGLTEQILTSGEVILFNRTQHDGKPFSGTECASYLGVPLTDKNKTFGVLAIQSYRQDIRYTETDKNILVTTGKQIATSILRKRDAESLRAAHENLERRVWERTSELEETISKRRKVELKLQHDSLHDALTDLPNRSYFTNLLDRQVAEKKKPFAVLFLDLDRFKLINDSLGHHVGDLFLIEISHRLAKCLRNNDVVARLGGDEFCILMKNLDDQKASIRLASRILKELKRPVIVEKHSLITSASIGIRFAREFKADSAEIMSDADAAMYQAKHQGKNRFCLFDADIKQIVSERMQLENDLREALLKHELYLNFQPIVDLKTSCIVGCEALIRWNHPAKGLIPPDKFIPIAEETGLIVPLGEFVLKQTIRTLIEFSTNDKTKNYFVNINISAIQILSRTFDTYLRRLISKSGINPALLNIEITESILIEDYKAAQNFVRELKSMGVKIYLDDFGTGFSSLSYLHQFPFDVIKLDKSFIHAMEEGERNLAIVESIASMANNLKMKIVAEGIETQSQLDILGQFDYQYGQGYLFSKPVSIEQIYHCE